MMCRRTLPLSHTVFCRWCRVYVYAMGGVCCVCMPCVYILIRQVEGYLARGALNTGGWCVCKRLLNPLHKLCVYAG